MDATDLTASGSGGVKLRIRGLGHIPALKNSMYAIVKPEHREWKKRCVQLFASQLISTIPMSASVIRTRHSLQSLIASLPQDDSWKDIQEIHIRCRKVQKGEEGAEIIVQRITSG